MSILNSLELYEGLMKPAKIFIKRARELCFTCTQGFSFCLSSNAIANIFLGIRVRTPLDLADTLSTEMKQI